MATETPERWKAVSGYAGRYEVSDQGRVIPKREWTHCQRGHTFDDAYRYGGQRTCRTCVSVWRARRSEQLRSQVEAA
jgi:hypothetical protein